MPQTYGITWDLERLRQHVRAFAGRSGLTGERVDDLVLAVHEAAANVLERGGDATLSTRADREEVWVDVVDARGTLTEEPLGGEEDITEGHGAGLALVRRLCDDVRLDHPGGGTRLRLGIRMR